MLGVARRLAAKEGVANARFVQGDAQVRPFRRAWCDAVISNFGVMFFDNPRAAFTNMAAAVRPGGRLTFLSWRDDRENEVFAIPLRAFPAHTLLPRPATGNLLVEPQRITDLVSGTGWQDVQVATVTERAWIGSDVDDVMNYVRGMPMIGDRPAGEGGVAAADWGDAALGLFPVLLAAEGGAREVSTKVVSRVAS